MLNPIHSIVQAKTSNHQELSQSPKLKKKCVMKKKNCNSSFESLESCSLSQNTHLYNIIYFNAKTLNDPLCKLCPFPLEIFLYQAVTKVHKNRDRITLDLKLCPKLARPTFKDLSYLPSWPNQQNFFKEILNDSQQNVDLVQVFDKISKLSQKQKSSKQNEEEKIQIFSEGLFLSQEEVTRRTENLIHNRKLSNYMIMESVFQQTVKKVKRVHISNSLLQILGHRNEALVFEILEKRALPFKFFKDIDYKKFVSSMVRHLGRVLNRYLTEIDSNKEMEAEEFKMEATVEASDKTEKAVTIRWSCSHPSLILIEITERLEPLNSHQIIQVSDLTKNLEKILC